MNSRVDLVNKMSDLMLKWSKLVGCQFYMTIGLKEVQKWQTT